MNIQVHKSDKLLNAPRSGTTEYIDTKFLIFLIHIAKYFSGSLKQFTVPATMHEHISPQSQQHGIFTRFQQKRKFYCKDPGATSREETSLKKVLSHLCSLWDSLFSFEAIAAHEVYTSWAEVLIRLTRGGGMGMVYKVADGGWGQWGHSERPWWAGQNLHKAAYHIHFSKDKVIL